jgi:hypothetical protein
VVEILSWQLCRKRYVFTDWASLLFTRSLLRHFEQRLDSMPRKIRCYCFCYFYLLLFIFMVNLSLLKTWCHIDGVEVEFHSFLTPAWDGGDWSNQRTRCFASQVNRLSLLKYRNLARFQKYSCCCEGENNSFLYNNCHHYYYWIIIILYFTVDQWGEHQVTFWNLILKEVYKPLSLLESCGSSQLAVRCASWGLTKELTGHCNLFPN